MLNKSFESSTLPVDLFCVEPFILDDSSRRVLDEGE